MAYTAATNSTKFHDVMQNKTPDSLYGSHHTFYGVLALGTIVVGVPANLLSYLYFHYRKTGRDSTVTTLYRMINAVDGTVCFLMIPIMVSSFHGGEAILFAHTPVCHTWAFLWEIIIRMSIFLIGVMSIARTLALINPLHAPRRVHVVTPVVVYLVLLIIQESTPIVMEVQSTYYEMFATCGLQTKDAFGDSALKAKLYFFFTVDLEFITPLVVIIISSVTSVVKLRQKVEARNNAHNNKYKQDEATKTILILTLVYIVLNIPYCAMFLIESIAVWSDGKIRLYSRNIPKALRYFLASFILTHTIALNSTINPLIYFMRLPQLRDFLLKKEGLRKSLSKSFKSAQSKKVKGKRRKSSTPTLTQESLVEIIRRKSSDIKLGITAALAIRRFSTDNGRTLRSSSVDEAQAAQYQRNKGRKFSIKETPIPEEEAMRVRRTSVLAALAYSKVATNS